MIYIFLKYYQDDLVLWSHTLFSLQVLGGNLCHFFLSFAPPPSFSWQYHHCWQSIMDPFMKMLLFSPRWNSRYNKDRWDFSVMGASGEKHDGYDEEDHERSRKKQQLSKTLDQTTKTCSVQYLTESIWKCFFKPSCSNCLTFHLRAEIFIVIHHYTSTKHTNKCSTCKSKGGALCCKKKNYIILQKLLLVIELCSCFVNWNVHICTKRTEIIVQKCCRICIRFQK